MRVAYSEGYSARSYGDLKDECPHPYPYVNNNQHDSDAGWQYKIEKRSQWLAGWHDRDMELGVVLTGSFKPIFAV